jgi:hypothetical protein
MKKTIFAKLSIVALSFVLLGLITYYEFLFEGDYSPVLTRIAKSGTPLIQQALDFYAREGHSPSCEDLRRLVKDPRIASEPNDSAHLSNGVLAAEYPGNHAWWYVAHDFPEAQMKGFSIYYPLTHDVSLKYDYDGVKGDWFISSDETPPTQLVHLDLK